MKTLTPEYLSELNSLCQKATPPPWRDCTWDPMERPHVHKDAPDSADCHHKGDLPLTPADAKFIAEAREAIPLLLGRLKELDSGGTATGQVRDTIRLLNSMVECGEEHSDKSRAMVKQALHGNE